MAKKKSPFEIARADGRSDAQVVFDLAATKSPGTLFEFAAILKALQEGLEARVLKQRVYAAVSSANKMLLRENRRYMRVVRGKGYRIIESSEHLETALAKKDMAQHYISKGKAILEHTDLGDLTDAQRKIHEGQLFVLSGLLQHMKESNRRHAGHEKALEELKKRVEKLEGE